MKIKEKVLKEVLFNVNFRPSLTPAQFSKLKEVIDLAFAERNKEVGKVIDGVDWTDFVKDKLMEEYSEETQADDFVDELFNKFIANKIKAKLGIGGKD